MPNVHGLESFWTGESLKTGDIIKFVDAGRIEDKEFTQNGKKQVSRVLELTAEKNGERKVITPNKISRTNCTEAWGPNTENWVGKECDVTIANQLVFDKQIKVIILNPVK